MCLLGTLFYPLNTSLLQMISIHTLTSHFNRTAVHLPIHSVIQLGGNSAMREIMHM